DDFQMFNEHSSGQFTGIGVLMEQKDGQLRVVQVFDNSPAQEAGIQAGDVIVVVDGQAVAGKSQEETSALIRGPSGSQVALSVQRGAQQPDAQLPEDGQGAGLRAATRLVLYALRQYGPQQPAPGALLSCGRRRACRHDRRAGNRCRPGTELRRHRADEPARVGGDGTGARAADRRLAVGRL
ncbi:MAG: hypothetical protein B7Z73_10405, partial [Planctomycetia bacterium 21-64-5]